MVQPLKLWLGRLSADVDCIHSSMASMSEFQLRAPVKLKMIGQQLTPHTWETSPVPWRIVNVLIHAQTDISLVKNNGTKTHRAGKPTKLHKLKFDESLLCSLWQCSSLDSPRFAPWPKLPSDAWRPANTSSISLTISDTLWLDNLTISDINTQDKDSMSLTRWLLNSKTCHWASLTALWFDNDWVTGCPFDAGSKPTVVLLFWTQSIASS